MTGWNDDSNSVSLALDLRIELIYEPNAFKPGSKYFHGSQIL